MKIQIESETLQKLLTVAIKATTLVSDSGGAQSIERLRDIEKDAQAALDANNADEARETREALRQELDGRARYLTMVEADLRRKQLAHSGEQYHYEEVVENAKARLTESQEKYDEHLAQYGSL